MIQIVSSSFEEADFGEYMTLLIRLNKDAREALEFHHGHQIADDQELSEAFADFIKDYIFDMLQEFESSPEQTEKMKKYISEGFSGIFSTVDDISH